MVQIAVIAMQSSVHKCVALPQASVRMHMLIKIPRGILLMRLGAARDAKDLVFSVLSKLPQ